MTICRPIAKQICEKTVDILLAAGYRLAVDYGEDDVCPISTDAAQIKSELGECDEEWLLVYRSGDTRPHSSVYLIYENDADAIVDHGMSLEAVLKPVFEYAQTFY
jgi:hypothetical protein